MKLNKLDANESVWFGRQLEHVKGKTYDVKYTNLKVRSLIPVSFEAPSHAETIKYEQWDEMGLARIVTDYSTDFTSADVKAKEFIGNVKSLGSSFKYNIQEIRAALATGKSLQQRKANSAKRRLMELENKLAYYGDAAHNLAGWLTNPNIPDVALPADGVGALSTFASKVTTPDLIVRDLNNIANSVANQSNGVHAADTMLMPIAQFTLISSTRLQSGNDMTVMKFFMENNPFIQDMDWVVELKASNSLGNLSGDTAIAYERSPDNMEMEVPQDYEQFPPEPKGMAFEVACHQRFGGVSIYYPLSQAASNDV